MKALILPVAFSGLLTAQVASWSWESVTTPDRLAGFHRFAPGISGRALRSDGQTTHLIRPAAQAPRLNGPFTIEAWVAIQAYPWTWCAIANQEKNRRQGFSFSIDPNGHFGLHVAAGGQWNESRSEKPLPLYRWNHIAAFLCIIGAVGFTFLPKRERPGGGARDKPVPPVGETPRR